MPTARTAQPEDEALNYHHLRYFHFVVREGSVAAAARALGVAVPTVSTQVRALERALGAPLFDRTKHGLVLTDAGRAAERYAEQILGLGGELVRTLAGEDPGAGRRLVVGVADALPKLSAARLLKPALDLHAPLVVRTDKLERLLAELAVHALDVVLSDQPSPSSVSVRAYDHLLGESAVTVFAPGRGRSRWRTGFPGSLAGAPFVLPTAHTALRRSFDAWCAREGLRVRVVGESEDPALLQWLAPARGALFVAPALVERAITAQYGVTALGRLPGVVERFYAITGDRRLRHPGVQAIARGAVA